MDAHNKSQVRVAECGERFAQVVVAGRHVLSVDEPQARGGQDVGPSPYEHLLIGLGACTAITIQMYVDRHGWQLRRIAVDLLRRPAPE